MKTLISILLAGLLAGPALSAPSAESAELKYGLYVHYGMDTFRKAEEKGQLPAKRFAPGRVDTAAWARSAKMAGMNFAVLTAKHESGFCLWESKASVYDLAHSSFKGDLIADFIAACKVEGLVPGVHYSIPDTSIERTLVVKGPVPAPYFKVMTEHLTELLSRYQELRVLLIDASQRLTPEQLDEVKELLGRLNPKCRLWTSTGPQGIQVQSASVNKRWMWSAQAGLNPAPRLYAAYARAQANGTPFLLNVGPKPDGTIPDNQLEVLKEVKAMIANPPAVAPASPAPAIKAPPSERLKQAKQLFEQGLIGKEDYDKKVKEIMDSI